ncbi:MAG: aspartate aminotransferase family protein [Albidovulum sp.]
MSDQTHLIGGVPAGRIADIRAREAEIYVQSRPKTRAALAGGSAAFLEGVPMLWMRDWPQPFAMLVEHAEGARITDIDGHEMDDFCLGDTGSMFGHSPAPVAKAIAEQAAKGLTYMLPTPDALDVGRLLQETFGPFRWQIATTATDANRFAIRVARAVTGRPKILFFAGCYHGAVDDAMGAVQGGRTVARPGLVGQVVDLDQTSVVVEFNDLAALEAALATGDVAAVLAEPVMTNCCMVLPDPGYHAGLRALTRKYGALLIIDETHTVSSGLGGYTRRYGLDPDMFVLGKPVAGGLPASVWGMSENTASRFAEFNETRPAGFSGIGTTLSANPLQFAAMRANLTQVMTEENYAQMEAGAARLEAGLANVIQRHGAPWHVCRVGARVEFICHPTPLRNGSESYQAHKPELEKAIHMALVNRGCLIAPFHNMMLVSPATGFDQIDRLIAAFEEITAEMMA